MTMTFIKRYLFDDSKLRDRALLELTRGLRNGRVIALTGSMTTEGLGYFSWNDLCDRFASVASYIATKARSHLGSISQTDHQAKALLDTLDEHCAELIKRAGHAMPIDARIHFSVVREALDGLDSIMLMHGLAKTYDPENHRTVRSDFESEFAKLFLERAERPKAISAIRPLLQGLGITRFVTLNYDLELERALMLRRDERDQLKHGHGPGAEGEFLSFVGRPELHQIARDDLNRLSRINGDGMSVQSDVLNRERVDRLIEFAVGSANIDSHILHLHGRADLPGSMVLDIRDYDKLYRRDDLFKNPFEHGLRVLFAGNPVLFVGVGMSEPEINATLQDFVSDSPYRRTAPAFLLWNTTRFSTDPKTRAKQKRLRRLDFLQRLGVFVIFDDDLTWQNEQKSPDSFRDVYSEMTEAPSLACCAGGKKSNVVAQITTDTALSALQMMLSELHKTIKTIDKYGERSGSEWRNLGQRAEPGSQPVRLWGTPALRELAASKEVEVEDRPWKIPENGEQGPFRFRMDRLPLEREPLPHAKVPPKILVGLTSPGFGRGLLAERILEKAPTRVGDWQFRETEPSNRLLVNAGFSYDSDALLSGIAEFLRARFNGEKDTLPQARELLFATGKAFQTRGNVLVILNGVDRFFDFDGAPLSAELDHLIRCVLATDTRDNRVQWLLLGTERLRRYAQAMGCPVYQLQANMADKPDLGAAGGMKSRYLRSVAQKFDDCGRVPHAASEAKLATALSIDRDAVRRAFFSAYLTPAILPSTVKCAVWFEILRTMAFIGWPIELHVLLHAPRVAAMLRERLADPDADDAELRKARMLQEVMEQLLAHGLVTRMIRFDAASQTDGRAGAEADAPIALDSRFGLHRALAAELRERHAVRLSEAKLASTFNMSLFAAQPADDYKPEPHFHDELGNLVDRLIGAWRDPFDKATILQLFESLGLHADDVPRIDDRTAQLTLDHFAALCSPRVVACLRAALAVIRGYFSTSNLLSLDRNDRLVSVERDGALTEHSDRLDRLLKGFGKIATARDIVRRLVEEKAVSLPDRKAKALRALANSALGPAPFYPDDLVWLHNERGVVKLAQGDLYAARRSFSLALHVNREAVEFDHHGHNWRRITLNMIGVHIERGRLATAELRLDDVEATIDAALWPKTSGYQCKDGQQKGRAWRIVDIYGEQSGFIDDCTNREFAREEILAMGLVTGYRGLVAQIRGQEKTAQGLYERAISILRRLRERRAYALFQRHYATLRRFRRDPAAARAQSEIAIHAADAAQQMDMSYRARLLRADTDRFAPSSQSARKDALDDIRRAFEYAALTDSYRARIEASTSLSRMMLSSREFDAALKHACDALAVACRFGHSLHKISLRVQIGEILIQRGDPKSGNALLDEALSLSSRIGFHRIVEPAQRARRHEPPPTGIAVLDKR